MLFTREYGVISAGTNISERGKSKSTLALQPFTFGRYGVHMSGTNYNIDRAEVIRSFYGLSEDLDKFFRGSYVLEFTAKALHPEARMPVRTFITGDSFMLGMVPYVFDAFPETEAYSRYYLDMDAVLEMKPEVFIYEIAERYVSELDIIPGYNTAALAE